MYCNNRIRTRSAKAQKEFEKKDFSLRFTRPHTEWPHLLIVIVVVILVKRQGQRQRSDSNDPTNAESVLSKAPSFNGKTVFPMKVFMNGLKGHEVAAVFAVMNKKYNRKVNIEGWDCVQHISITKDLYATLESLQGEYSNEQVAYVRALSFVYPQKSAMEEVAMKWKAVVDDGYGGMQAWNTDSNADADADADADAVITINADD